MMCAWLIHLYGLCGDACYLTVANPTFKKNRMGSLEAELSFMAQ